MKTHLVRNWNGSHNVDHVPVDTILAHELVSLGVESSVVMDGRQYVSLGQLGVSLLH